MWNIFSRIFLFAYDMLYRTSRRLLLFWTNSKRRITGTMDDKSSSKKTNLFDSSGESSGISSASRQVQSPRSSPVVKDVVIDIEANECEERKVNVIKYDCPAPYQNNLQKQKKESSEDDAGRGSCLAEVAAEFLTAAAGDEGAKSPKRIKLDKKKNKDAEESFSNSKSNPDGKKRDKKRKNAKTAVAEHNDKGDSRPNYFVAIQVSDTTVKSKVQEIQEGMLKKQITSESVKIKAQSGAVFKDTFVPVAKLHFTLHVFHLPDKDHLLKAQEIVEKVHSEIKQELEANPVLFTIEGLGHFRNSVLFAKIKEPHHIARLEDLSTMIRNRFESASIFGDTKVFQPHMTIAKMSRSKKLHKLKIRSFPNELWSDYELEVLGTQRIEALQLLSMTESDPTSGYYRCVAHLPFI